MNRTNPILEGLNPPQREAVETLHGPLMVLAGAGSGKTRVLTRRLAHIFSSGAASWGEVLAVTFTNKAAREMRERVATLLGLDPMDPTSMGKLWIGTFHGMGARILRFHADKLGFDSQYTILDASDQERMMRRLTQETGFEHVYWTPKRLLSSISRWKDDGIGPDEVDDSMIPFAKDRERVVAFYRAYQEALRRGNAMDFGDLLTNNLLLWQKHPEILDTYRRRFRFILVDEYQDTNAVQYRWLRLLAAGHGNLCVVGDDDQSIYSWRGARVDNILRFAEENPGTRVIRLEQNYRSTGNILKAASGVIAHNNGRLGKTLWTQFDAGAPISLYSAEDGEDEARFVAAEILRQCGDGAYGKVAVLVRASWQTRLLEEALLQTGIPYQVVGGLRFMERAEVKDAVAYLRLIYAPRDNLAFERVVNVPKRKIGPKALEVVEQVARENALTLMEAAERVVLEKRVTGVGAKGLEGFVQLVRHASLMAVEQSPEAVLVHLLKASGYEESLAEEDREEDRRGNLEELKSVLRKAESITDFLEMAVLDADAGSRHETGANRVVVSTLHAAKGLEFPVVILTGLEEGLFPHQMAVEGGGRDGLEEERRLAYVGMTRARASLILTHARRRFVYGTMKMAMPSRFLKEIPKEIVEERRLRLTASNNPFARSRRW